VEGGPGFGFHFSQIGVRIPSSISADHVVLIEETS